MFGNKGIVYTLDIILFVVIILSVIVFMVKFQHNTIYTEDLTFKEFDVFFNGKTFTSVDSEYFLCRDFNTFVNGSSESKKICSVVR